MRRAVVIVFLGMVSFLLFNNRETVSRISEPWVKAYLKQYYTASLSVSENALVIYRDPGSVEPIENPFRQSSADSSAPERKESRHLDTPRTTSMKTKTHKSSQTLSEEVPTKTVKVPQTDSKKWLPSLPLVVRYQQAVQKPVDECANCGSEVRDIFAVTGVVFRSGQNFGGRLKQGDFRRGTPALYIE
ncbi:MAG: hypothetical protein AB7T49_08510 [Oligoflexales bacterium]